MLMSGQSNDVAKELRVTSNIRNLNRMMSITLFSKNAFYPKIHSNQKRMQSKSTKIKTKGGTQKKKPIHFIGKITFVNQSGVKQNGKRCACTINIESSQIEVEFLNEFGVFVFIAFNFSANFVHDFR